MSEDRLDKALQEMQQESIDAAALDAARARVWNKVTGAADTAPEASATPGNNIGCDEFRSDFRPYLSGTLASSRRVLMEDHLSRCSACRIVLAELKGERRVIAMPQRASSRRTRWGMLAAAAVLFLAVLYGARDTLDAMLAPGGPRATVVSAEGGFYRVPGEALGVGATIGEKELVRTVAGAHAVLRLGDGSTIDVNERTELYATAAWSGQAIHLQRGDVIVSAAKQRRGHLRVFTRDSIASVKGTVFAVSTGLGGSVVSVVEGSVAVSQPGREVLLTPGQQAASNTALASSVAQAVAWSPSSDEYLQILATFGKIERQLAETFPTQQRNTSALLTYLPAGAFAYGAIPNLGGRLGMALTMAEEQSSENAAFNAWWNTETGQLLRQMVNRLQSVSALLGDEVVFCAATAAPGHEVPMVMARVQPGKQAELTRALHDLFATAGEDALPHSVSGDLMVVASTAADLTWALSHLQPGAASPFAAAIGERYRRGTGWLMAIDAPAVIAMSPGNPAPPAELAAMVGMKYLFVEQRAAAGREENELTLVFDGQKKGMASWLADAGAGGVAEYLPADALFAGYVSMREPWQIVQEFTAMMPYERSFENKLAEVDEKLGAGFLANLTGALGNEAAFTVDGFSVAGPRWTMVALAYNPAVIDDALRKFVDVFNAELGPEDQNKRVVLGQENVGGRIWNTMKGGELPLGMTWSYDQGYLVAASERATAERAIATRNGGSPLVWSPEFQSQLPSSAGIHPSAFAWLNTKGALGAFSTLAPSPAVAKLLSDRDPLLVVFDGKADQIHAASRERLPGLVLDVMLLNSLDSGHHTSR